MSPARLLARFLCWLTWPGSRALDALDDPGARRDCPGAVCADLPTRTVVEGTRRD